MDNLKNLDFHTILDRRKAISFAMKSMKENDILLIAGKGHETYQEIRGHKYPFDDVTVVQEFFATTSTTETNHTSNFSTKSGLQS